ncbi:hypothetical protein BGZ68_004602 [Mortierella alpina]|nr:hypothetical protein BGZ68_004602 [Mortierella alpina]
MISLYLKRLILSLSLATLSTLAAPAASGASLGACGSLDAKQGVNLTYDDVAKCYRSIPFDSKIAASTMETIQTFVNDHYVFRDSAMTPDLMSPFSCPPVDIMKQLKSIGSVEYADDFSFHTAVSNTLNTLQDNHVGYRPDCYGIYQFTQDLLLYAPVINGKQSIHVFKDLLNRGYDDCEVKRVNGQEAFAYLSTWSSGLKYSKDAGVRLNEALASQRYAGDQKGFAAKPGAFAERRVLPEAPFVTYDIQCESNQQTVALQENWKVTTISGLEDKRFNSAQEYVTKVFLLNTSSDGDTSVNQSSDMDLETPFSPSLRKRAAPDQSYETPRAQDAEPQLQGAEKIVSGGNVIIFQLKAHPKIGVVVIPSHSSSRHDKPYDRLVEGLIELHKRNVTNVIVDVQGNGGGDVSFSYRLVRAFFPSKDGFDISLPTDVRAPKIIQELAAGSFDKGSVFDAKDYVNLETRMPYSNTNMFTKPEELETLPWTNKPVNIHILTDGRCGSACGMSTHMFSAKNISVTAIGGIKNQPLSMFSFAGGVVQELEYILEAYKSAGVNTSLKNPPYQGLLRLPVTEVYAQKSDIPLEYDAAHYRSTFRLDFDPKNARDRVTMWTQVATHAWHL